MGNLYIPPKAHQKKELNSLSVTNTSNSEVFCKVFHVVGEQYEKAAFPNVDLTQQTFKSTSLLDCVWYLLTAKLRRLQR